MDDLERTVARISKREFYGPDLLNKCQKFADILADKQWCDPENRRVSISRGFEEVIGRDTFIKGVKMPATSLSLETTFIAEKMESHYEDEKVLTPELSEIYTISLSIKEAIASSDVPGWIIEQLAGEVVLLEDDEEGGDGDDTVRHAVSPELIDAFEFKRETKMSYTFNEEAEIENFAIEYRYYKDDEEIDRINYSWYEIEDVVEATAYSKDKDSGEYKRSDLSEITAEEIDSIQSRFDSIIDSLTTDHEFDNIANRMDDRVGMYLSEAEHCRRALGMLALNARRLPGLRF